MITSFPGLRRAGLFAALAAVCTLTWISGLPGGPAQASTRRVTGRLATVTPPPGREWASFAYDPLRRELVLFGGESEGTLFGDTWILKDGVWTEEHPGRSPSARAGVAMVYDPATGQLLLFGGFDGRYRDDTWLWTGTTWRKLAPAASPSPRHNADMFYDAATQNVILFGGYDGEYLGDTWSWDGTTWTQLSPTSSPSARDSESLVYDAATQTAIMYGGYNYAARRLSDTWSWDGSTWTELYPADSPGVVTTAWSGAYDAATGQVLLFGGDPGNDNPPEDGTWDWTGTDWTQLTPAFSPPGRVYGSLTYNTSSQQVVMFGGSTNGSETVYPDTTFSWNGSTWRHAA